MTTQEVPDTWTSVDALLLDFDGVIVDSEYVHYRLWREEFHARGLLLSTDAWAEHWAAARAEPGDIADKPPISRLLEHRLGEPLDDPDGLTAQVRARYRANVAALPVRPGIQGWLREAASRGARCAVVTDNKPDRVRGALDRLELAPLVDAVVGRDPSRRRKPAPDVYRAALDQLGVDPGNAIAVEDSLHGIAAARAVGLRCLAVPHKITSHLLVPAADVAIVEPASVTLEQALALLSQPGSRARSPHVGDARYARRIWGSLAGLGLGDALGKLIDKRAVHQLEAESVALLDAFEHGNPPPPVFAGRITDDTVLALALATTIIATGRLSRDAFERDLRHINPHGGRQVYKLKAAAGPLYVAADGATNGCVPRSATIGFLHPPDELGDLCYDVLKIVTLTHSHPDAVMAALIFTVAISHAVAGGEPRHTQRMLPELLTALARIAGGGRDVGTAIIEHAGQAYRFPELARYVNYLEDTIGMAVAARSSAVAGICLGLSGLPPRQVLPVLLRRRARWDLDSVAAIYGALAGAYTPGAVPHDWVERVEHVAGVSFMQIADGLQAARDGRRP